MPKHNLFTKKLKKQFLSVNDSIESYFNKLKFIKSNLKKIKLIKDYKAFLISGIVIFLIFSYFLLPIFFNKELIKLQMENQISKKYNIDIKINKKIKYRLFPKPHYSANDSLILRNKKNIAEIKNFKIYVSSKNFFNFNQVEVKNLYLKKTDFVLNKEDLTFFKKLLNMEPNENKIIIKNSKIFFKGKSNELLFINKIKKYEFYYDSKNLLNVLSSNNEIFNTPYKLIFKNDKFNQKLFSNFKSKKIRLSIDNEMNYDGENNEGLLNLLLINKSTSLNYKINNNSLNFESKGTTNNFNGKMDFKPFYLHADFNYDGLSSKKILADNSIIYDLIKSQIFNNSNLNVNLNLNVKDIVNVDELNKLKLKIFIEDGNIDISESSINWKNDVKIVLKESIINYDNENIFLVGKVHILFKDPKNFYKSFQVKKYLRKNLSKINFDINYSFSNKDVSFYNVRVDDELNIDLEKFINRFNSKTIRVFNKITFKNFVNSFFKSYSG
jgi:hypothetical protein